MRRFDDAAGRAWDVVIGRESFGTLLALFVPAGENRESPRQVVLSAESHADAETALETMRPAELNGLFERSQPKEMG